MNLSCIYSEMPCLFQGWQFILPC